MFCRICDINDIISSIMSNTHNNQERDWAPPKLYCKVLVIVVVVVVVIPALPEKPTPSIQPEEEAVPKYYYSF